MEYGSQNLNSKQRRMFPGTTCGVHLGQSEYSPIGPKIDQQAMMRLGIEIEWERKVPRIDASKH